MTHVLIGIDDTDNADSPGTGQLARRVSAEIERFGGRLLGTTRHQFLVDPRIPYTGHNRGICVATDWDGPIEDLNFVFDLVAQWSAQGSDPGVCLAHADSVQVAIVHWGERAMRDVLSMDRARTLAQENDMHLRPLGGTGQGIIGALASVGLRAGGEFGRFVDMPGLRTLGETVTVQKLAQMGITVEHQPRNENSRETPAHAAEIVYKTLGWIRPRLSRGKAILAVEWSDHEHAWVPVDRKTVHPLEQG